MTLAPEELLARLQAAESDEAREWLTLQFSLSALPDIVAAAAEAAAIPHWFAQDYLQAILAEQWAAFAAQDGFASLTALSFIEPSSEAGYSVHERTRTLLLAQPVAGGREPVPSTEPARRPVLPEAHRGCSGLACRIHSSPSRGRT
jgi:hypothetical protein